MAARSLFKAVVTTESLETGPMFVGSTAIKRSNDRTATVAMITQNLSLSAVGASESLSGEMTIRALRCSLTIRDADLGIFMADIQSAKLVDLDFLSVCHTEMTVASASFGHAVQVPEQVAGKRNWLKTESEGT